MSETLDEGSNTFHSPRFPLPYLIFTLMGFIFGGEPITLKTVLGILTTVGGIILLTIG